LRIVAKGLGARSIDQVIVDATNTMRTGRGREVDAEQAGEDPEPEKNDQAEDRGE
jgi:hypothetical protein